MRDAVFHVTHVRSLDSIMRYGILTPKDTKLRGFPGLLDSEGSNMDVVQLFDQQGGDALAFGNFVDGLRDAFRKVFVPEKEIRIILIDQKIRKDSTYFISPPSVVHASQLGNFRCCPPFEAWYKKTLGRESIVGVIPFSEWLRYF